MQEHRIRWWPAVIIVTLAAALLARVWLREVDHRQGPVMASLGIVLLSLVLLLVWLLFASRLRRATRLRLGLVALGLVALSATLFRITGVSGDFLPTLDWRWRFHKPATAVPMGTAAATVASADYPEFLGPGRRAVLPGPRLARDWSAQAPRELWRRSVGEGWSSFAVVGDAALTQEQQGEEEVVVRYALTTGEIVWSQREPAHFASPIAGNGPRATPTVADGRVYAVGATGLLRCLDLADGRLIWSRQVNQDGEIPEWGKSGSPLLVDDRVVVTGGGPRSRALVAYDRATGEPVWQAGDDREGYSSPLLADLAGSPQIVVFNASSVAGHDPRDGRLLWQEAWSRDQPNVAQPLVLAGDRVLVSSGYGVGSALFRVSRQGDAVAVEELWRSTRLKAKFTNLVFHEGSVYGLDDGTLVCLDPETGERRWKRGRYGHGQLILVGDLLLIQAEDGDVVLVEARPDEHHELGRFTALHSKTWNPPALAGRYLLVRNDHEAACFELPLAEAHLADRS